MDISSVNSTVSPSSSYSNSSSNSSTHRLPLYRTALHSVRKLPGGRTGIMKKPIAPMPPTPTRIYKVNPVDFRDVVQRLTGALEFQATQTTTRLREVAPPPLSLSPPQHRVTMVVEEMERKSASSSAFDGNCGGGMIPLGFSLSPSSIAWCSSILLSPSKLPF